MNKVNICPEYMGIEKTTKENSCNVTHQPLKFANKFLASTLQTMENQYKIKF